MLFTGNFFTVFVFGLFSLLGFLGWTIIAAGCRQRFHLRCQSLSSNFNPDLRVVRFGDSVTTVITVV